MVFEVRLLINRTTNGSLVASKMKPVLMAVASAGFVYLGVTVVGKSANEQVYLSRGEKRIVFKKTPAPKGLVWETKLT